jgi:hypothetical protein
MVCRYRKIIDRMRNSGLILVFMRWMPRMVSKFDTKPQGIGTCRRNLALEAKFAAL